MSLYLGTTEITNIDNLVPQSGLDITDLWFGSTKIYTVWQTYEGTLPATINANGDDMKQYQIWGNVGGVGNKTVNLFDPESTRYHMGKASNNQIGRVTNGAMFYIRADADMTYIIKIHTSESTFVRLYLSDAPIVEGTVETYNLVAESETMDNPEISITNTSYAYLWIQVGGTWYTEHGGASIMLTEGTTPPASFVPFGYEVDMVTGSNILQSSEIEQGGWYAAAGVAPEKIVNFARCRSKNIYTISSKKIFYDFKSLNVNTAFIDSNGLSLGGSGFKSGVGSVDVPANAVKCLFIIANTDTSTNILPTQVIAAGIWASVDATTTPIYIGDDPLDKDEYVDYQAGKIYRMIDSTLTPTDPPVALPALPTCEGETVIDYAGSGTAPEKVLLKYRKEGF